MNGKLSIVGILHTAWIVLRKELIDALRDRRTLTMVLVSSVLMGPLMLLVLSSIFSASEAKSDRHELYVQGQEYGPTFCNYLKRQGITAKKPPADYEAQLHSGALRDAVVVISEHFEDELSRGEQPDIEVVFDSGSREAASGAGAHQLFDGFIHERAALALALRGVSSDLLKPIEVSERDLANSQARGAQLTSIVSLFVLMAVVIGALNAALDTTAGERERGSLEPLLMTPGKRWALVLGKWGAVTSLGVLVAGLSCLSFLPAQELLHSESLQAMFQFGGKEVMRFLLVLTPFAAAISAVMMAIALYGKTVKEAQAQCSLVMMLVNLAPLVMIMNPGAEADWLFAVPGLAQSLQLNHILKGETLNALQFGLPLAVCLALTVAGVWHVSSRLKSVAVK